MLLCHRSRPVHRNGATIYCTRRLLLTFRQSREGRANVALPFVKASVLPKGYGWGTFANASAKTCQIWTPVGSSSSVSVVIPRTLLCTVPLLENFHLTDGALLLCEHKHPR